MKITEEKELAKKLVQKLIGLASDKKCDKIILNSSEKNSSFYKKIGFEKNQIQMIIRN
jgi:ribosomal protein S18 acetylase RimI-like enzyme